MTILIVFSLVYLVGYAISYGMLYIDHVSEGHPYTRGARTLNFLLSILSWFMIIIVLIKAWVFKIKTSGYWDEPIKPADK